MYWKEVGAVEKLQTDGLKKTQNNLLMFQEEWFELWKHLFVEEVENKCRQTELMRSFAAQNGIRNFQII